jgi:ABC-2 type transport system permease protein
VRQTLDALLLRANSAALTAGVADAVLVDIGEQTGVEAMIEPWRAEFVRAIYTKTETLLAQRPPAVDYEAIGGSGPAESASGFSQSVPGVGSMYVMFTVLGGMVLIQRERQRWTLQRLGVFPLTRGQILGGKILTYFTLGMLQYLVVFAVGLVVGLDFGPYPLLLLPTMAAFVLCCTALTFAIAPSLRSEGQASVVTQLLSLTFAALGGAWWPLEIVPEFMQRIGHLTPVAWVMDAFRELLFYGGNFTTILPELGVLFGAAVILFGVGSWRFRYL